MEDIKRQVAPLILLLKRKQETRRESDKKAALLKQQQQQQQKQQSKAVPLKVTANSVMAASTSMAAASQKRREQQQQPQLQQQQQVTTESTMAATTSKAAASQQQKKEQQQQQQTKTQQQQQQERSTQVQQRGKLLQQPQPPKQKKEKVPPINVYKMELQDTINLCKSAIGNNFTIKRLNNNKHAIQCFTVDEHKKIRCLLKEATTEFFSFTPKAEKVQTVLLKGIDSCTEPKALLDELRQKAGDDLEFIGVKPFQTVLSRREKRMLPMFLVQLSPQSKLDSLRSISVLNYQLVSWDKLKRRDDMLQCMRCQRFGHASANCEMQSRCVKCGENHIKGECKLGSERVEDRAQLKCVLCRDNGHPANYRGCSEFQRMKANKVARQVTVVEKRPMGRAPTATIVNPQISYAQMAAGRGIARQPTPKVAPQVQVPKAPEVEAPNSIMAMLLSIQGQLTGLQGQIREQTERVDHIYSLLPGYTQFRS